MPAPRNARSRGSQRYYSWRQENYWSVTTILQAVPKPALVNWAKKYTAEYACDHFAQLSALLEPDGDGVVDRQAAVDWLKGAAWRERDRKADIGSQIHAATEAYVLGKPFPTWPKTIEPQMRAFVKFLDDYQPVFHVTEASVYNRSERYAGTLDGIVEIDGRVLVGDTKSGKAIYPEVALQLAAYRFAEFIGAPDGSEQTMPKTDGAFALHLPAEGGSYDVIDVKADEEVFRFFLYFRESFRWMEELSKTVLLGPLQHGGTESERAFREAVTS
jgi:hypothetical protein